MADDDISNGQAHQQAPEPNPALGSLDALVGTWDSQGRESGPDGEIRGRVIFEWMEGGFYLVQCVEMDYIGGRITGTEYIGYGESNEVLKSYFFSNTGPGSFGGVALEYVWEVGDDRNTATGRREWPGGGYEATMTRAR